MKNKIAAALLICVILLGSAMIARTAITELVGLAVAQSSITWNNVKDAAAGDNLTNGLLAGALYFYDGTNFDRARGDTTFGLDVDVTRFIGITSASDNSSNPSAKLPVLPCVATTTGLASWTNGNIVPCTTDLQGRLAIQATSTSVPTSFYAIERSNITTSSVNLAFGGTSTKIKVIVPLTNTDDICIDYAGGTAACPAANTAGNDRLKPGTSLILDSFAATSVSVIAASGTQTVQVAAWR